MEVQFFSISDDKNVINKTLGTPTLKAIIFLDTQNILNPILRLKDFEKTFNYVYIPNLNRYYFIDSYVIETNELVTLYLKLDVLKTYSVEIKLSTADIIQAENDINENRVNYENELTDTVNEIDLYNPFNDSSDILVTVQGVTA